MKNIKQQILNLLSQTPICTEELFDLGFNSNQIHKAIEKLKIEGKVEIIVGELAYIKLK
jgi:biotin operon repressor